MTNPRLMLNSTPVGMPESLYPELTVFDYDLNEDHLTTAGNELACVKGRFFIKDGVPMLCSDQDSVAVKLSFDYVPELVEQMANKDGYQFGLLSIIKLDEPWEESESGFNSLRRVSATDENYYTNYTVYPLQVVSMASVDELVSGKQVVDVRYISPSGISSGEPHDGVNIVVTTHDDGSQTAVKRIVN